MKTSKIDYDRYLDIQIDMCLVFKLGGLIQKQLFFAKSGYPFGGEKHHIISDYHRSCGLCEICFIYKDRSTLTEVLVFPDLCSNEVNCFITKTEILLNLLLRGGEMSKRFAL